MTTFVLVHGAFHSGQCWSRVVPLLAATGHRVYAPSLTGYGETRHLLSPAVGLDTHAADIVDLIEAEDLRDVVLVGHSYAGLVISAAANRVPERIARLVYLDAMVPTDGERAVDVMPVTRAMVDTALASASGWRVAPFPPLPAPHGLFGVTDPADVAWLQTMLSDHPVRALQQPTPMDNPDLARVPRTHIRCTVRPDGFVERPVPPVQPNGSPADVRELPTGHDCMITMPSELSAMVLEIAGAGSADPSRAA